MSAGWAFRLQRLRSMSGAEVAWRVRQRVSLAAWSRRAGKPVPSLPRPAAGYRAAFVEASAVALPAGERVALAAAFERDFPGETARLVALAEQSLAGRVTLFDRVFELGRDPARWPWNRSPDGGPDAGSGFGPTLDYRDPAIAGDARLAWELGRHGVLPAVAQAAWLTGEARYAGFVFATLEAWIAACPAYTGLQWASALEYALRAFSWGWSLALIARTPCGEAIADERWERVFAVWAEQMRFVSHHDARFSSANNHRLGEAAGLAWSGRLLAFVPGAGEWRERGLRVLEESFLAQTTADGVTKEHAFQYQQFVLDFVVRVEALEARAGRAIPVAVRERVANVARALDAFAPGGIAWPVGDGDEGQALPTGEPFAERARASIECACRLAGEPLAGQAEPRAWWFGLAPATPALAEPAADAFVAGGYAVLRRATPAGEARLLFDAAELGLAPLYAHGHADALMVLLDVRGPRLVDPGTGGYHAHAELRERLRATAAHNTVEIDGVSQSMPGGLFQWLRATRVSEPLRPDAAGGYVAAHDGYARLAGRVVHRRRVSWPEPTRLVVEDWLEGEGRHEACVRWHVGDGRPAMRAGVEWTVDVRWPDEFGLALVGRLPPDAAASVAQDAVWSPRFLAPRPCGVVTWRVTGALPLSWSTEILLQCGPISFPREIQ